MLSNLPDDNVDNFPSKPTAINGRWVVVGLFGFGIAMSSMIWLYWYLNLAPVLPLQRALAKDFPKSYPRVEGGRNKDSPNTLRVVLQVQFELKEDDPRALERVNTIRARAIELIDLANYEVLEIYLVHRHEGEPPKRLEYKFPQPGKPTEHRPN